MKNEKLFFQKLAKTYKPLARVTDKKRIHTTPISRKKCGSHYKPQRPQEDNGGIL
jgi:hypothetical protein